MKHHIPFNKERSIKGSITDSWKIFVTNRAAYLRHFWIYLLLTGMTGAFFIGMCLQYTTSHLLPALRLHQIGGDPKVVSYLATPTADLAVYLGCSLLLALFSFYLFGARQTEVIGRCEADERFPQQMKRYVSTTARKAGRRLFLSDLIFALPALAVTGLTVYAAFHWHKAVILPALLLLIYIGSAATIARWQYADGRKKLTGALTSGLRRGFGHPFIVQLITFIPVFIVCLIATLPLLVYVLATWAAYDSQLRGDSLGLPAYLPFVFFILNSLSLSVCAFFQSLRDWAVELKMR